jgi:hypothetical protein
MAVTAAPVAPLRRNDKNRMEGFGTVGTQVTAVYQHTLVVRRKSGRILKPADVTTTMFMGIAINRDYAANEVCSFAYNFEVQLPLKTTVVQSMVGTMMYAFDNFMVTNVATIGPEVGPLTEFTSANLGYVWLRGPALARAS